MNETELKPCPLCGNRKINSVYYDPFDGYQVNCSMWRVSCRECGCNVTGMNEKEAVEKWNRRATDERAE